MKKIIFFLLIVLLSSSVYAQRPLGFSYPANELLNSISARASGMGETGVSHVHAKSHYLNPGSLGLYSIESKLAISGYLKKAKYTDFFGFYNSSFVVPLQKSKERKYYFAIGGYYSISKILEPIEITTYEYPDGIGEYLSPSYKNYNATFAVGYDGSIQVGVGLTFRHMNEFSGASVIEIHNNFEVKESSITKSAFDFGFIARYPIMPDLSNYKNNMYLIPAIGFAVSNFTIAEETIMDGFTIDLPKKTSIGLSLKTGLIKKIYFETQRELISFLPSYEFVKIEENDWERQYGLEFGLMDILFYRTGTVAEGGKTDGYSINSRGFFSLVQPNGSSKDTRTGLNRLFTDKISIEYSYANSINVKSYHEIIVTLSL